MVSYYLAFVRIAAAEHAVNHIVIHYRRRKLPLAHVKHGAVLYGNERAEVVSQSQSPEEIFRHGDAKALEVVAKFALFENVSGQMEAYSVRTHGIRLRVYASA